MDKAMTIKLLSSSELKIVRGFSRDSWVELYDEVLSDDVITRMMAWMFDTNAMEKQSEQGNLFYLYSENDVPLAYISIEPFHNKTNELKIHSIYVLPIAQNNGIGKLLIQKAIEIANENGIHKLVFVANRFSLNITFFKHLGFSIESKEKIDIGNGHKMVNFVLGYQVVNELETES